MKMKIKLLLSLILVTILGMTGCNTTTTQTEEIISVAAEDVNLGWEECSIPNDSKINGVDISQVETCFNLSLPLLTEEEKSNFGIKQIDGLNTELYTYKLTIGTDLYETKMIEFSVSNMEYKYALYKNGDIVQNYSGQSLFSLLCHYKTSEEKQLGKSRNFSSIKNALLLFFMTAWIYKNFMG